LYDFQDVPYGNYTIHASLSGYAEGTCAASLSASQDWCSIALSPSSEGEGDTDTEVDTDTGEPGDSGTVDENGPDEDDGSGLSGPSLPGSPTQFESVGAGCSSSGLGISGWLGLVGALGLARRRSPR
jgi:hypothetical protein